MSERKTGFVHYLSQAWLVLVLSVCFGAALAGVEGFTRPKILRNQNASIARKLVEMFGAGTTAAEPVVLAVQVRGKDRKVACYPARKGARRVGWGILAEGRGYDTLMLLIGVDDQVATLVGYRVVKSLETPGIGDRIEKPGFTRQFEGKDAARPLEAVPEGALASGQQVNTISGATYSSGGVVRTINDNLAAVREKLIAAGGQEP